MLATVAILSFNSDRTLKACLEALRRQDLGLSEFEVIVVDHGSTDQTINILNSYRDIFPNFQIRQDLRNNLGFSRAQCVHEARSENLVFVDSDCELDPKWLSQALRLWDEKSSTWPDLAALCGPCPPPIEETSSFYRTLAMALRTFWGHFGSPQNRLGGSEKWVDHSPTTACLFRKSQVLAVGNFKAEFHEVCEDYELGRRLVRAGKKILFSPDLVSRHHHRQGIRPWILRIFKFGRGQIKVAKQNPSYFLSYRVAFPLAFLPTLIGALVLSAFFPLALLVPALYLFLTFAISSLLCHQQGSWSLFPRLVLFFVGTHFAYSGGQWAAFLMKERAHA